MNNGIFKINRSTENKDSIVLNVNLDNFLFKKK